MIEHLNSLEDERLDVFMRLTELQLRNRLEPDKGIFIAESDKVIVRALDAGYEPLSLLIPDHKLETMAFLIKRLEAIDSSISIFVAPAKEIEALTGYELTRGVLCAFRRKPLESLPALLAQSKRVAVLENITNHTNIGALFRSAAALNVDAIILNNECCDPLYRRAIRVSMGTVFQIPWTRVEEGRLWPGESLASLRELGFTTAALALNDQSISLDDERLKKADKLAVLFGTEGTGLTQETLAECDYVVKIPMAHGVDSLNVAAASAVTFWELFSKTS